MRAEDSAPAAGAPQWHRHGWNRGAAYRLVAAVGALLPRRARLGLAERIADLAAARGFAAERAAVEASLARFAPDVPAPRRDLLARQVFRNFAVCFADLVTSNRRPDAADRLVGAVEGQRHLQAAGRAGRGLVLLTAHVGNWDLAGRILARRERRAATIVVAAERDPAVARFLRGGAPDTVRFVSGDDPRRAVGLVAALRRGEVVAFQGDRALGTRGDTPVPFFGAAAAFPRGPFVLARAAGAPLVPVFCLLAEDRRYRVRIGAPIGVGADETTALRQWVAVLEREVRAHPTQWFNFFDVWAGSHA